jgi:hypothetical protein
MAKDDRLKNLRPATEPLGFLTRESWEQVRELLANGGVLMDPTQFEKVQIGGKTLYRLRPGGYLEAGRAGAAGAGHPFQVLVAEEESVLKLRVRFGACTAQRLVNNHPTYPEVRCFFVSGGTPTYLVGDPWNPSGTVGSFTLATNTTYGVWLKVDRSSPESQAGFGGDDYDGISTLPHGPEAVILVDSTATGPGYWSGGGPAPDYDEDFAYVFLARVAVSSGGVVTVTQHRKSDIELPFLAYPYGINFPE